MAKAKLTMEVGKRYKGYGMLNEYGEYLFEPCRKLETTERNMKIVRSNGSCTLYESKNFFRIAFNIPKNVRGFFAKVNFVTQEMRTALKMFENYLSIIEN